MASEPKQILEYLRHLYQLVVTLEQTIDALERSINNLRTLADIQSWIASRADKAIDKLEEQPAIDDVLRELSEYLTNNIDRIDQILLLILEKMPEGQPSRRVRFETDRLKQETIANRLRSLKSQLRQHTDTLNYLEEQASLHGANVPVELHNQIDWTKDKIAELSKAIESLQ